MFIRGKSSRTQGAMLRRQALRFFGKHQTWRALPFNRIARLLETAFELARLATGMETRLPPDITNPPDHSQALADLHRAYGDSDKFDVYDSETAS